MQLDEWLKWYDILRVKFGYSVVEDQNAARFLSELLEGKCLDLKVLSNLIYNKNVLVVGIKRRALSVSEQEIVLQKIKDAKTYFGIGYHHLERLLSL